MEWKQLLLVNNQGMVRQVPQNILSLPSLFLDQLHLHLEIQWKTLEQNTRLPQRQDKIILWQILDQDISQF